MATRSPLYLAKLAARTASGTDADRPRLPRAAPRRVARLPNGRFVSGEPESIESATAAATEAAQAAPERRAAPRSDARRLTDRERKLRKRLRSGGTGLTDEQRAAVTAKRAALLGSLAAEGVYAAPAVVPADDSDADDAADDDAGDPLEVVGYVNGYPWRRCDERLRRQRERERNERIADREAARAEERARQSREQAGGSGYAAFRYGRRVE